MKKTNDLKQMTMFDTDDKTREFLKAERTPFYFIRSRGVRDRMVVLTDRGFRGAALDLRYGDAWVTNSRKEARRVANSVPGFWEVLRYPYMSF